MLSERSVAWPFPVGCIDAEPFICTAPASAAGLTSEPRQREFTFTSPRTSLTGSRWNGLQAAAATRDASTSAWRVFIDPPERSGQLDSTRGSEILLLTIWIMNNSAYHPIGQYAATRPA